MSTDTFIFHSGERTFLSLSAGDWEAIGTWATVLVAVVAAWLALRQIREAKQARIEESWPYVAVFMEAAVDLQVVDLVVKNFGRTAATDIRIESDLPIQRSGPNGHGAPEDVWLPTAIPTLVPGQEWRTLWDFGPSRADAELPDRYVVTVTYRASDRSEHDAEYVLDWASHMHRRFRAINTLHDVGRSLKAIEKEMGRWKESINGPLAVYVRDGHAKDAEDRARYDEFLNSRAAQREQAKEADVPNEFDADDLTETPDEPA